VESSFSKLSALMPKRIAAVKPKMNVELKIFELGFEFLK
jgi:hypothetical protein